MHGLYTQKRLLEIIDKKESYDNLLSKQISYSEIAIMIVSFLEEGYIINKKNGYDLTEKGREFLTEKYEKIQPLDYYRLSEKMNIDEIYYTDYIEEVIKELKN